ncbi:hypothetical protein [Streptomyces sp. NPDC006285]|uniref:hypothetical protein n=1 Tax=Streptomyces sp. NPDC006285 TaxID=3364742 RepID=UPI0036A8EE50
MCGGPSPALAARMPGGEDLNFPECRDGGILADACRRPVPCGTPRADRTQNDDDDASGSAGDDPSAT